MIQNNLKLDWCTFKAAKYACLHWHYSKCMPVGKLVKIGVLENSKFIGCVLFGRGANNGLGKPYGLNQDECVELVRIALNNHVSTVSRIVSIAIKLLLKFCKKIQLIVSFADSAQGHFGSIYQAGNWVFNGQTTAADEYIYKGKRYHGRSFRQSYGSHKNHLNKGLQIIQGSVKYRYLMPLTDNLKKQLTKISRDYPKPRDKQAMTTTSGTAAGQH